MMRWSKLLGLALPVLVHSLAATDSTQDTDAPQSGYLPNHNMDPNIVGTSAFALSWKNTYNALEVFYAKPLVFTPPGAANEQVIAVSNQNIIRVIDGLSGQLINSRTLDPPFQSVDSACGDIPNTVGITGTPIIDTATSVMYFFSKGYKGGATGSGTINGQYKMYAVNLPSLTDAMPPVIIDGNFATNDPTRYFVGGTVLQRPGLAMLGNTIVAGFGGHCDNFNYTGMLVAVSKTPGVGVTNIQATEASPGAPSPQTLDITIQGGGKAGIWQSGMGLAADTTNNRVFFVTGNARGAGQNKGAIGPPSSGKIYLSTLEQCAVSMNVDPNAGALNQADYFEPYEYDSLNGGDRDFGSAGIALLDPVTFSGGGVNRVAVAGGKSGKVYVLNADNLGGFAGGTGGADNVLQTIVNAKGLLSGPASYPLEGGYLYLNPTGDYVYAYKMGTDSQGRPQFTLAGKSASTFAGASVPTITSMNGQPGTGIVWLADTNQGLVAFHAVPVGGVLQQITPLPSVGGTTKYQRVTFGNGRAYIGVHASIAAVGSGPAVTPPLSCIPNPVAFGSVTVGASSPLTVTCKAGAAITMKYCTSNLAIWSCLNSSLPTTVASGTTFTFPVTMGLTPAALAYARDYQGTQVVPGNVASLLNLAYTIGNAPNTVYQLPLTGTVVAATGYLAANAQTVDFGGIVMGSATQTSTKTITLTNDGKSALTFTGFAFQNPLASPMTYTNITVAATSNIGTYYTATGFPAVGSSLAAGASITITMTFAPHAAGSTGSLLSFWSNGGFIDVLLTGTASGVFSSSTLSRSSVSSTLRSSASASSGTLTSRSSLPSVSSSGTLTSRSSLPSVSSGTLTSRSSLPSVSPRQSSSSLAGTASSLSSSQSSSFSSISTSGFLTLHSSASSSPPPQPSSVSSSSKPPSSVSSATYTSSSAVPTPAGPTIIPSVGLFNYIGCFTEGTNTRALGAASYPSDTNTIAKCAAACSAYTYFGAEYSRECWCGNSFGTGSALTSNLDCSMTCSGDSTSYCGAGNRLTVYIKNGTSSSSSTASAPTPFQTPAISSTIGKYAFQGCYTEGIGARALTGASFYNYTAMTLEMCASSCSGFTFWGVEYGGECYCGNTLDSTSVLATNQADCSFSCPGNQTEHCGAGNRLQMYKLFV